MAREIMQFTKPELENELSTIKNWLDFNEEFKNIFINQLLGLGFTSPRKEDVFNAVKLFKPNETKVLILGQDPYPAIKKACGLAFLHNTEEYNKVDDTLKNILSAVDSSKTSQSSIIYNKTDFKIDFKKWASDNKVLLLNTSLTYRMHPDKGKPYKSKEDKNKRKLETKFLKVAHQALWKPFIKSVISNLVQTTSTLVVFLWGEDAKDTFLDCVNESVIDKKFLILSTSHLSNMGNSVNLGFSNDAPKHFELCNDFLKNCGEKEIYWKDLRKIYVR